jgi:hypothetical protein
MSCFCDRNKVMALRNVAIIGSTIDAYICAHQILDNDNNTLITLFDESAEAGFAEDAPGIFLNWPLVSTKWYSGLFRQTPNQSSTAVRYAWFLKSIAIALSKRNATFLLRTKITKTSGNIVEFEGAGLIPKSTQSFDNIFDFRKEKSNQMWNGGISTNILEDNYDVIGKRVDGTIEVWWQGENRNEEVWLQTMSWCGTDPRNALEDMIGNGIITANTIKS